MKDNWEQKTLAMGEASAACVGFPVSTWDSHHVWIKCTQPIAGLYLCSIHTTDESVLCALGSVESEESLHSSVFPLPT